jgi:phosphoribosylformimino-5-aminoimidazole carboxamide ribonucleotide (ProFAR) isomerase
LLLFSTVDALARRCPQLHTLRASNCTQLTDAAMRYVAAGLPRLHTLDVSGCHRVSDNGIHAVITHCKELGTFVKPS